MASCCLGFIKAQLSAEYVASLIDFFVTILLVKLSGLFICMLLFWFCGWRRCELRYQLNGYLMRTTAKKTHVALEVSFVWEVVFY